MGEKQWKVCAKELITRCVCVLFWRGGEGYGRTGAQGNEGGRMDGYEDGWMGHVMGNWNQKARLLCLDSTLLVSTYLLCTCVLFIHKC